ncbi:hypothetical protein YTPLAS18_00180 [Nitrospira sp.]|nr:hypothetical protein YTPLAS18_00180 [Nitrospira sp.]
MNPSRSDLARSSATDLRLVSGDMQSAGIADLRVVTDSRGILKLATGKRRWYDRPGPTISTIKKQVPSHPYVDVDVTARKRATARCAAERRFHEHAVL